MLRNIVVRNVRTWPISCPLYLHVCSTFSIACSHVKFSLRWLRTCFFGLECFVHVDSSKEVSKPCGVKIKFTLGKKSPSSPSSKFEKDAVVEATSDETGFEGSWFTAKVIDRLDNGKYLLEYLTLMTNDETGPLREEVHSRHTRPYPPHLPSAHLKLLDRVDAWYNEGWWEGRIAKVLRGFKFVVYFATSNEELVFDLVDLRPHQDWISGKWVLASKDKPPRASYAG